MIWNLKVSRAQNSGELTVCDWVGDWLQGHVQLTAGPEWDFASLAAEDPMRAREYLYYVGSMLLGQPESELRVKDIGGGNAIATSAMDGRALTESIMARQLREDISPEGPGLARLEVYREMPVAGLRRVLAKPDTELLGVIQNVLQTQ
jgi:hypothetical protein